MKFRARLRTIKSKNLESIRSALKEIEPGVFEFEVAQDFIPSEFVDEYLEMYSDLTILTPRKYFQGLFEELTRNRRAEFITAEDIGEDRTVL